MSISAILFVWAIWILMTNFRGYLDMEKGNYVARREAAIYCE